MHDLSDFVVVDPLDEGGDENDTYAGGPCILDRPEPWHGVDGRIEVMNRLALFRYLSGRELGPLAPHFGHYFKRDD